MSELKPSPATANSNNPSTNVSPTETISYTKVLIILLVGVLLVGSGGYALGKLKFWKTYDSVPRLDKLEALWTERINGDPNNPNNYVELGYVYYQKQNYDKATPLYQKAIALDPNNYKAHYNLGLAYVAANKKDRAVEEYKKAIEIAPKAQGAHLSLGMLYLTDAKYDQAESELQTAYTSNPGDAQLLYNLGFVKEKLGKKDEAIGIYKDAVSLMPTNKDAKAALDRLNQNK